MHDIVAEPLTAERFRDFGDVLMPPAGAGRIYYDGGLKTLRPGARASLSLARREEVASLPHVATLMERHQFSSQSFVPIDAGGWLVLVAPHGSGGKPDMQRARAFLPAAGQGITFGADVWHHPLTVLGRPGLFAISMWLDGSAGDEEFFTLPEPVRVVAAA